MESYYKFTVSKGRIIYKVSWCWVLFLSIPFIQYNQDEIKFFLGFHGILLTVFVLSLLVITILILFSAIYNGRKFLNYAPFAELEIFNDEGYLIYRNIIEGQTKEIKVQLNDIYFIKRNFCDPVYLYFDEVFYTENKIIKRIVLSIALVNKIEKIIKTSKKVKVTEYHNFYYEKIPLTT